VTRRALARTELPYRRERCSRCGNETTVIDGAGLRSLRISAGLSQREVARRMGVSPSYLCDVELNRRRVTVAVREAYEALG
jgi:predicted transcriptional regulator